ncbi:DUF882 domain-containing protein [Devosia sp.]|uniref:DUF882 domain-containing protein n=1 Tax=Devosia sp. TaxID=1871048 RepID=UPI0025F54619|nr:DUF882 domain-containing protein [Devosia sp.]MCR6636097.1 DUF882 domain-containing protein [Devosia sp.]
MTGISFLQRGVFLRFVAATLVTICLAGIFAVQPALAATERALYLYYTHTKETSRIVFKRNGQYVQSGLNELNQFLRDWRRNEPTKMDPRLFDLIWEVYQEVGGSQPINVVSAYRSPATNAMLADKSSGVADNSQHMRGTAMDFFIPGVPLAKLRAVAMSKQVGGVGFYPTSGSPFVHLDVGSVRAWPRMTRAQLKEIFPDGRTMHLPTDGKPLSQEGYNIALAEWKQCHAYPCNGRGSSGTMVADAGGGNGKTLMDVLFGGKPGSAPAPVAAAAPAPVQVAAVAPQAATSDLAPVPAPRPASMMVAAAAPQAAAVAPIPADPAFMPFSTVGSAPLDAAELTTPVMAPIPAMKSETLRVATASALPAGDAVTALAALTEPPTPMPPLRAAEPEVTLTAYAAAPTGLGRPVIASLGPTVTGSIPATPAASRSVLASVGTPMPTELTALPPSQNEMANLFSGTFTAAEAAQEADLVAALTSHVSRPVADGMRKPDLVAPDFEHVADVFAAPASLSSNHFAVIFDRDEADFDPTPEMGRYVIVMGAGEDTTMGGNRRFAPATN